MIECDNCTITVHRAHRPKGSGINISLDFDRGSVYADALLCADAAQELILQLQAALVTEEVPF